MKSLRIVRRLILNELPISGLSITSLMLTAETERPSHGGLRPEGTELSGSLGAQMKLDSFGQLEQRHPSPIPKYLSRKNSPLQERSGRRRAPEFWRFARRWLDLAELANRRSLQSSSATPLAERKDCLNESARHDFHLSDPRRSRTRFICSHTSRSAQAGGCRNLTACIEWALSEIELSHGCISTPPTPCRGIH